MIEVRHRRIGGRESVPRGLSCLLRNLLRVKLITWSIVLCVSGIFTANASTLELDVVQARFGHAGWTTEVHDTSLHRVLIVSNAGRHYYMFRFERWPNGLRGYPNRDPNLLSTRQRSGDPVSLFFETPDWREMVELAVRMGFDRTDMQEYIEGASSRSTGVVLRTDSNSTRVLTGPEGAQLILALRRDGVGRRNVYDAAGERVEDMPFDTMIKNGRVRQDVVWLELESKADPIITKYPIIARAAPTGLRIVYEHKDDTDDLPFDPAFPEVVEMYRDARDLPDVWNWYGKDNQGQAGLWLRSELRRHGGFAVWTPQEQETVTRSLNTIALNGSGLVYARSNSRAMAQFYDRSRQLKYAEFLGGDLLRTRSLEEALEHLDRTNSSEVWRVYSGVSQQFGHPEMLQKLYATRAKAGS